MLRLTGLFVGTAARPTPKGLSHTVHDTAHEHGRLFFEVYGVGVFLTVVELGSQDVNGSLREHCPEGVHYIGLDVMPAKGVDLVVDPGSSLPLATGTADAIVTSSAFEHDICFWDTFLELTRILRPGGLLYVNVPSNGDFHRYPLDCWRFYPDAGVALVQWAGRRGIEIELIEFLHRTAARRAVGGFRGSVPQGGGDAFGLHGPHFRPRPGYKHPPARAAGRRIARSRDREYAGYHDCGKSVH